MGEHARRDSRDAIIGSHEAEHRGKAPSTSSASFPFLPFIIAIVIEAPCVPLSYHPTLKGVPQEGKSDAGGGAAEGEDPNIGS